MVDGFSMTAGVNVPLDTTTMLALFAEPPRHLKRQPFNVVVNDRRFAETIYRTALASGLMDRVAYRDASSPAGGS